VAAPQFATVIPLDEYRSLSEYARLSVALPRAADRAAQGSPEWWRDRLLLRLFDRGRVRQLDKWERYYCGDFDLPWLPEQAEEEFRRVVKMARANVMGLVVDATAERYGVVGFRFGDDLADRATAAARTTAPGDQPDDLDLAFIGDEAAWDIWQRSNMDAYFPQVIHDSVKLGTGYLMVSPNPDDPAHPYITREHPTQVAVAHRPGPARRVLAAGLKAWRDDWTGEIQATLYLPDLLYKWQSEKGRWIRRTVPGEPWPAPNPLGEVPFYGVPNYPNAVSEIDDVMADQDRLNKTLVDRLMTQDYGAFPQRWAIGFPSEDKDGNPTQVSWGRNRMVLNDVPRDQAAFGQWDSAPLDPYINAKREDVRDISARKRIPAQYLLGEMSNVNGQTLKAAEVGLVAKTLVGQLGRGEGVEDAMRAAFRLAGDEQRATAFDAETIWRNPEFRTEGELVDALVKMATLGVPREVLWEKWGATPQEIRRWRRFLNDAAARGGLGDLTALVTGQAPPPADAAAGQPAPAG
jgi:hypothetical protein